MTSRLQNKLLQDPPDAHKNLGRSYKRIDFEFLRKIGDGAYGQVWKVKHKKTSALFALKQVPKAKVVGILQQFSREVNILYKLSHPHIIKLLTHFEDDKCFYLIMELIEGGTLFHKLYREKNLLEATAAQYFREVVLAVEYLHSQNPPIVHRDIKPENILLDREGRIKLIDFGWANYCERQGRTRKTFCGTSEYMPPEIIGNIGHDTSADIWCLGVLLYEMLVGTTPFKNSEREEMSRMIVQDMVRFPQWLSSLSADLIGLMLTKDYERRPSIYEIKHHLWLKSIEPIRPTIVQHFEKSEVLANVTTKEIEYKKDYTTEATDSGESEGEFEGKYAGKKRKKSLEKMRENVLAENAETNRNKEKFEIVFAMMNMEKEKLTQLEEKISKKRKENSQLSNTHIELCSKIFDANLEVNRLEGVDINELAERKKSMQRKMLETGKECKIYRLKLDELRKKVNKESVSIANNEFILQKLKNTFEQITNAAKHESNDKKSSENELKISIEFLKQQLIEKTSVLSSFCPEELLVAKDISSFIKARMDMINDMTREISKKIEFAEEKANDVEQMIQELKINYDMKKGEICRNRQNCKDKITQNQRIEKEVKRSKYRKNSEETRKNLKFSLNESKLLNFPIDHTDIEKAQDRIKVLFTQNLKSKISRLEKITFRKIKNRSELQAEILKNHEVINCNV